MENQDQFNESVQEEYSSILTLSPIVELEENDVFKSDSSLLTDLELDNNLHVMSLNEDFLSPLGVGNEVNVTNTEDNDERELLCPSTPPEELKKQLTSCKDQIKYLSNEYNELVEFTKLEKQINHADCIPKVNMVFLQDELSSVNNKVEDLIQENTRFVNQLNEKDNLVKELLVKVLNLEKEQEERDLAMTSLEKTLRKIVKDDIEEINRINMFLSSGTNTHLQEDIRTDYDESSNVECLLKSLMHNKTILKQKYEKLLLTKFDKDKKNMLLQFQNMENNLFKFKSENNNLKDMVKILEKEFNISLNKIMIETENLYNCINSEKEVLQTEIANLKSVVTVDDIQEELCFILNQFENIISSWDFKEGFNILFCKFKEDDILSSCIDMILHSNTKTMGLKILDKLLYKLTCYDNINKQLCLTVNKLDNRVKGFESDSNELKQELQLLDNEVKQVLSKKISCLENMYINSYDNSILSNEITNIYVKGAIELKDTNSSEDFIKVVDLKEELKSILSKLECIFGTCQDIDSFCIKVISTFKQTSMSITNFLIDNNFENILVNFLNTFKTKFKLINITKDYLKNSVDQTNDESIVFNKTVMDQKVENASLTNNSAEELINLKNQMIFELYSLNNEQKSEELMTYSISDIFSKLMQNIMLKEDEISSNLQKQFSNELLKCQDFNDSINNKLKAKESWVEILESENEKMSIELGILRKKKDEDDALIKTISSDLRFYQTEKTMLKNKLLETSTENDELVDKIDYFKNLVKTQKDCLEGKINELNKELTNKQFNKELLYQMNDNNSGNTIEQNYVNNTNKSNSETNKNDDNNTISTKNYDCLRLNTLNNESDVNVLNTSAQITDLSKINVLNQLVSEKVLLEDLFKYSLHNTSISEQLSSFSENVSILKDVILIISNGIMDIEANYKSSLQKLQNDYDLKTKELNDMKSSMYKMFNEYSERNSNTKVFSNIENTGIVMNELQYIQKESQQVLSNSKEIKNICSKANCLFKNFKEQLKIVKSECKGKSLQIDSLNKINDSLMKENLEIKRQHETISNHLEEKSSYLKSLLLSIDCMFSKLNIEYSLQETNFETKLSHIVDFINNSKQNNDTILKIANDINFFGTQCYLMTFYISNIEERIRLIEEQNCGLILEVNTLKTETDISKAQNQEANLFFNQIIDKLHISVTSPNQVIDTLNNILSEYKSLKEEKVRFLKEIQENQGKINQMNEIIKLLKEENSHLRIELSKCIEKNTTSNGEIIQLQNEFKSLIEVNRNLKLEIEKYQNIVESNNISNEKNNQLEGEIKLKNNINNSLKLELSKCQDYIRTLRSELRSIRLQNNKRENGSIENQIATNPGKSDIGIQTDDGIVKKYEYHLAQQQKVIANLENKITALELQIQNENNPLKTKVSDLEKTLIQAKEKIRFLNIELRFQKNSAINTRESK